MLRIDLNCDLGEDAGHDAELMPFITSANIACGIHAGDVDTMRSAVELAQKHHVAIGAHPSLNDRENFGRRELSVSPGEVHLYVLTQIKLLQIIARQSGAQVVHVKPHGALYNMAARDAALADAVASAVFDVSPALVLFGLAGSHLVAAGRARGLRVASEAFADRTYEVSGKLTPRTVSGALIADPAVAAAQVVRMVREGVVRSRTGGEVRIVADTICLHGDGAGSASFAESINRELRRSGFELKAFTA